MAEGKSIDAGARAIREHVELGWDEPRVDALLSRMKARARRRTIVRAGLAAAAMIALGTLGAALVWPRDAHAPAVAHAPREAGEIIHLADGSRVTPLTRDSEVVVMRVNEDEILLDVVRGGARFEVVRGLDRSFDVLAGEVRVTVVGTVFEVRRRGEGASVRVIEGHVRVSWPDGEAMLGRGDEGAFPRAPAAQANEAPRTARASSGVRAQSAPGIRPTPEHAEAHARPEPHAGGELARSDADQARVRSRRATRPREQASDAQDATHRADPVAQPSERAEAPAPWRALAERGEYAEAARLLADDAQFQESADIDELLLASDTMRLSGQPERALTYLDRAARLANGDARAPLVAFTRGRLLLDRLGRFREAAEAFASARALAPDGSLAMDALAREVEALARGGDADAAHARAEEYVARYPNGLRLAAVRRWGGLDAR